MISVSGSWALVYLQEVILPSSVFQSLLYFIHERQYPLLLQPLPHDLNSNRQAMHLLSIVMLIRSLRDAVQVFEQERSRQSIEYPIDMSDGYNTARIVKLPRLSVFEVPN